MEELRPQNEEVVELGFEPGLCDFQSGRSCYHTHFKDKKRSSAEMQDCAHTAKRKSMLDLGVGLGPRPCSLAHMQSAAPSVGNPHTPVREGALSASRSLAWNGEVPN